MATLRNIGVTLSFLAASLQGKLPATQSVPDEMQKMNFMEALNALLLQVPSEELTKDLNALGYVVLALLAAGRPGSSLEYRLLALDNMMFVLEKSNDKLDFLKGVMPAVCSGMAQAVSAVEKEHHQVVIRSICVLDILLVAVAPSGLSPEYLKNIGALLSILRKTASQTKDPQILGYLRDLTSNLVACRPYYAIANYIILLVHSLDMNTDALFKDELLRLRTEAIEKIEDERGGEESKQSSLCLLTWIQRQLDFDEGLQDEYLHLFTNYLEAKVAKDHRLLKSVSRANFTSILNEPCSESSFRLCGNLEGLLQEFEKYATSQDAFDLVPRVMEISSGKPSACLVLLGRSIRAYQGDQLSLLGELVVDQAIYVMSETSEKSPSTVSCFLHCLVDVASRLKEDFGVYWRFSLMDFLSWAASPDIALSSLAASALQSICFLGGASPLQVIHSHLDYVIDQLGLQLRCPTAYPLAPRILGALLSLPEAVGFVLCISDLLEEVIESLVVYRKHDGYVYELLEVLSASARKLSSRPMLTASEETDEEEKLSKEQEIAKKMITIASHFVMADRRKLRIKALDCISALAQSLTTNPGVFLPLVHLVWPAVLGRVSEADLSVSKKALQTVSDLALVAGDFMQSRVNQELWPVIAKILPTMHDDLKGGVFACFEVISEKLKLSQKTVEGLALAIIDALRLNSPAALREAAVKLGEKLITCAPDRMWFHLVCQADWTITQSSQVDLRPYKLSRFSSGLSRPHLDHLVNLCNL